MTPAPELVLQVSRFEEAEMHLLKALEAVPPPEDPGACLTAAIPMDNPCCSCKLTRVRSTCRDLHEARGRVLRRRYGFTIAPIPQHRPTWVAVGPTPSPTRSQCAGRSPADPRRPCPIHSGKFSEALQHYDRCGHRTTWTIARHDGPNHLGL